jgi:sugar lactone lactonase YvrE
VRVIIVVAVLVSLWSPQQQELCADLTSCRSMAEAARDAKDYEAFHDLAWAAYRKGKNNDPELMLLVARAQSLSGRPGDALVMLERIAADGAPTDAATSEDFARVRALPRWSEVAEKLSAAPSAKEPASGSAKASASAEASASAKASADKPADKSADKPSAKDPASASARAPASAKASADKPADKTADKPSSKKEPLSFTTLLIPSALAFDAVSHRYLIADRKSRRVAVVDANTGQVATMVGALGSPGEIVGMAIDAQQGDLWIASSGEDGPVLHKLQLISGRMLQTVPVDIDGQLTAMTYAPGTGLIAADANGVVWTLKPDGKAARLAALEYVPQALAADAKGRLYVSGGTSRFARFSIGSSLRKIDTVSIDDAIPKDAPFVAVGSTRLTFIVPAQGSFEVRNVPVK